MSSIELCIAITWNVTASRPQLHQPLLTIPLLYGRWSTCGSDKGNAHFFTATSNTIEGTGEKKEQTNKHLGLKESYVTLCMCRLTLWTLAKLPQSYWNADSSWLDLLSLVWTLSHADSSLCSGVQCRLLLSVVPRQLPTSQSLCLTLWLAFPPHFRSRRDRGSKTLCLVSRQNRQRNRLLGRPHT